MHQRFQQAGIAFGLFLLCAGLCACPAAPPPAALPEPSDPRPPSPKDRDEDRDRDNDRDRYRKKYSGPSCEEDDDDDCIKICRDIYTSGKKREACAELTASQVEALDAIYDILKNPNNDKLAEIDPEDFREFVDLDTRPLEKSVKALSSAETKHVLTWIAETTAVAAVFENHDDDYKLLKELLKNLVSSGDRQYQRALQKSIESGESFIELALVDGGSAMDWIHGFVEAECENKNYGEELCMFQDWYCRVNLNADDWSDFTGYNNFNSIMDAILQDYTTNPASARTSSSGVAKFWTEDLEAEDLEPGPPERHFDKMCDWRHDKASSSAASPKIVKRSP